MRKANVNILFVGIGGQGILLASEITARAFLEGGYDVKTSTGLGIAQRGGSVVSHVRAGEKINSPLTPRDRVDIFVALESAEALRHLRFLKKNGLIIFVNRQIFSGLGSGRRYNVYKNLKNSLRKKYAKIVEISYCTAVKYLKDIKTLNIFVLGVLSNYLVLKKELWRKIITEMLSSNARNANLVAFSTGQKLFCKEQKEK